MKRQLITLIALLSMALSAAANERPVTLQQLPAKAQKFLSTHFPTHTLSYAKYDNDITDKTYDVIFTDGTKVEFGRRGEWKKVECRRGTVVPAAIVPQNILSYVEANFPEAQIVDIEKHRFGYEVKLSGGIELNFDSNGRFRHYDD